MLKVGITGGIGSGKTTVCKIFELLNVPVFYADEVAKTLMVTDASIIAQIISVFGSEAYFADQTLNRKHIADRVFNNAFELATLNSFVHPAVFKAEDEWTLKQKSSYVLKEAALLFESGSYKKNNCNILVSAFADIRIARVMKRDGVAAQKVKERIQNQMSEEDKHAKADFYIVNNDNEFLITQVLQLHGQFIKLNAERSQIKL